MHPVIRVLALVVLAAGLATAEWVQLAVVAGVLGLLYGRLGGGHLLTLLRVARRLRFLFLSIAIVYLWFTPGPLLLPSLGAWSPSWPGLEQGLLRVSALLLLIAAVQLLLGLSSRSELLAAIRWWARPLRLFGLSPERLALRMVLTLEAVPKLQALVAQRRPAASGGRLARIGGFAGEVFAATLAEAERVECPRVELPTLPAPAPWQWALPLAIGLLFALI